MEDKLDKIEQEEQILDTEPEMEETLPISDTQTTILAKDGSESVLIKFQGIEIALSSARIGADLLTGIAYGLFLDLKKTNGRNDTWTDIMNRKHKLDLKFTMNNLVWRPEDLIKRAFELPKYSFILLDEWEDATYWSKLGITLRQFFRKCRQLNLFMMVIIPNWFQLPLAYAVSRSVFSIDIRFTKNFTRGSFYFYDFQSKRTLFVRGRKEHNYRVARPTLWGAFTDGYGVPDKEYRQAKLEDMYRYDKEDIPKETPEQVRARLIKQIYLGFEGKISQRKFAKVLGITQQSVSRIVKREVDKEVRTGSDTNSQTPTYNNIHNPISNPSGVEE